MDLIYLKKFKAVIGCDEVGRGPLAGPVVAAAVRISSNRLVQNLKELHVTDSKKLSLKKRKNILSKLGIDTSKIEISKKYSIELDGEFIEFCISELSPFEIDRINILQASLKAMKFASEKLISEESIILIDGNKKFESTYPSECVIKGDSKVIAIALASIIAKVFRDEKMAEFDELYSGYNLKKNAGYPTKEHRDAIKQIGVSPIHRKSFKGVKEYI